jgi:hypothetical protein
MSRLPHERYIDAVFAALADSDLEPDGEFVETPDGERLDAVMTWNRDNSHLDSDQWPHGVLVSWSQFDGWEYAATNANGSNEVPSELVHEWIPAPESVVDAVRLLLRGSEGLPVHGRGWILKSELEIALREWDET